ncbi:unnamed protein product [Brassica oleracea]
MVEACLLVHKLCKQHLFSFSTNLECNKFVILLI